jgi:hypothetical protein
MDILNDTTLESNKRIKQINHRNPPSFYLIRLFCDN